MRHPLKQYPMQCLHICLTSDDLDYHYHDLAVTAHVSSDPLQPKRRCCVVLVNPYSLLSQNVSVVSPMEYRYYNYRLILQIFVVFKLFFKIDKQT